MPRSQSVSKPKRKSPPKSTGREPGAPQKKKRKTKNVRTATKKKTAALPEVKARRRSASGNKKGPPNEESRRGKAIKLNESVKSASAKTGPIAIPVTWLNTVIAVFLLPLLLVTIETFFQSLTAATLDQAFWRTPQFWFFHLGIALWFVVFAGLRGPHMLLLYVFGHEYTHAAFVLLCGGRLLARPYVSYKGGEVLTDKSNVLISLSPYFVPFYSMIAGAVYGVAGLFLELGPAYERVLYGVLGFTWAFHLTFTFWMVIRSQPDLRQNGTFFSLTFILLINLLILSALFVIASPTLGWRAFALDWWDNIQELVAYLRGVATNAFRV